MYVLYHCVLVADKQDYLYTHTQTTCILTYMWLFFLAHATKNQEPETKTKNQEKEHPKTNEWDLQIKNEAYQLCITCRLGRAKSDIKVFGVRNNINYGAKIEENNFMSKH